MLGIGLGCSPWEWLNPVVVGPPPVRSVVSFGERLERFARRRASSPSLFLATVAGVAGRLNDRTGYLSLVGEPVQEGRVAVHQPSWRGLGSVHDGNGLNAWKWLPNPFRC